jgi:L-ascorbate metabolism protein UlaG (beta-lactamase superfamily)
MEIGKTGVEVEFLGHSGFMVKCNERVIIIDPYNLSENFEKRNEKADLILITHTHYDHCSIKDIEKAAKPGCTVVIPADGQSKIMKLNDLHMEIVEIGEEFDFGNIRVEALPAYNVDKDFHPKKEGWLGYLVKLKNVVLYHSGDTDKIPEMKRLTGYGKHGNEFVAILPVSGKYVMDVDEAVDVASLLSPDLVIPMHYGAGVAGTIEDAKRFVNECKEINLNAVLMEKI